MSTPPIMLGSRKSSGATSTPDTAPTVAASAPAERERPAHPDADEPGGLRVGGHRAHAQTDLGVLEEQVQQAHDHADHADDAQRRVPRC